MIMNGKIIIIEASNGWDWTLDYLGTHHSGSGYPGIEAAADAAEDLYRRTKLKARHRSEKYREQRRLADASHNGF